MQVQYFSFTILNVFWQVHVFLKSTSWDTRIAAGQAIEAIAQNVPQWNPSAQNIKGMICK